MPQSNRILCRELSLLEFNRRVLAQAQDARIPLLERLRFLCIVSSNLDEFFEVRMAYLRREHKRNPGKILDSGMTPAETLAAASVEAHRLIHEQYDLFNNELQPALSRRRHPFLPPPQLDGGTARLDRRLFRPRTLADTHPRRPRPRAPLPQTIE